MWTAILDAFFSTFPPLMRTEGTVELLSAMDAAVFPVTGSPMDMGAVRHFIDILGEQILTMGKGNIRELYLLRNMIEAWERRMPIERCRTLSDETGILLMQTSFEPLPVCTSAAFRAQKRGYAPSSHPTEGS